MASITYTFTDSSGFLATCTITEVDGTLVFVVEVDESTGQTADLRGLFFDLNNDGQTFLNSLTVTGDDVTDSAFKQDSVVNLGNGNNVNGSVVNETGRFDGGVELGTEGISKDDIQSTTFTLSSSLVDLTLDMVTNVDTALRATSSGDVDGSRNGSLKLVGDVSSGAISGSYFWDQDLNDVDNAGDTGVAGKWVTLLMADGTTPVTDASGNLVAAVQTDVEGRYFFSNLSAGDYVVMFQDSATEGLQFVQANVGTDEAVDSDVDPATGRTGLVTVVAGYETTEVDAGVKAPPAPPPPPASISGRYFDDANRNDIDDGESGISDQTVELLDAAGNVVQTTTAADGSYFFENVAAGTYTVRFEAVAGKIFSSRDAGSDDSVDSDVDASGVTAPIIVDAGVDVTDVDAGVKDLPASVSGRYFDDANGNGIDDAEAGIAGKTVTLLDGDGAVVATALTQTDGSYHFADLAAGSYSAQFEATEGKQFSGADAGDDDTVDSDVDADGMTAPIVVEAGMDVADVDAGVMADSPAPWDMTGTISTAAHSLTYIIDGSFTTFDAFFGIPPVDINQDGTSNVLDAILARVIERAQDLSSDLKIDLIMAGADGVAGQMSLFARDLQGLDPHDFADEAALQAIFAPTFYQPAGQPTDVDFTSALTAAGDAIRAGYGAAGAAVDEVVLLTTSDGIDDWTFLPSSSGHAEASQALATEFGASVDVMLIESLSSDWSVITAIDSDGVVDSYSSFMDDPWNPDPDPYKLGTLVSDSPAITEADILGLMIGGEHFAFTDASNGDGRIDVALSGLTADPLAGIGIEVDIDHDGVADMTLAAGLDFVDGGWRFDVHVDDLLV